VEKASSSSHNNRDVFYVPPGIWPKTDELQVTNATLSS